MDSLKHNKIELYFTRDFSLCTTDLWHDLLAVDFKREFGIGIDKQIMRFNGRAIEAYRDIEEMERVEYHILSKGLEHDIFSEESLIKFKSDVDEVVNLINEVDNSTLDIMIDNFAKSVRLFKTFYPYVAFSNFLPSRWRGKLFSMYPEQAEEIANRWYRAREFSEGKFEKVDYYWRELISKLLKKYNIDSDLAHLIKFKELKELIKGNISFELKEIIARKNGYIFYQNNFIMDQNFPSFLSEYNFVYDDLEIDKEITELKGQVASKGELIKGKVQIVLNIKEMVNFREGSILVTSMTVPDFVPAMKKSKAIVTDEGGITCHAAIVSRELKVPCIIGTKIATKILKDGDEIEVDTNKGIIKIIK